MTPEERRDLAKTLRDLWRQHDRLERQILLLERKLTDDELRRMGAAGAA